MLAIPYVSEEPDPLYWANFRIRVMEQISQTDAKLGLLAQIQQFLTGHLWGSSIAISAAALLVAGVMIFQPFSGDVAMKQAASAPAAVVQERTALAQAATPDLAAIQAKPKQELMTTPRSHESLASNSENVSSNADLAVVEEPSEQVVSLDELSKPQLEAIVQDLENNE